MASLQVRRLETLLHHCANGTSGIYLYQSNTPTPEYMSYASLQNHALHGARYLQEHCGALPGRIILVHFSSHRENILWFWASILAGCTPAMSTPLVNNEEGKLSHLAHLHKLLLDPLVITSRDLLKSDFANNTTLTCVAAEGVEDWSQTVDRTNPIPRSSTQAPEEDITSQNGNTTNGPSSLKDVAALMLTSGSTGAAKAVCLTHEQILAACNGKLAHLPLPKDAVILNWIGLNHVGSFTELHITAMVAGCDQIQVPTADIIADPLLFLRLLSKHRVSRTFAPNFMLAKLLQLLDDATPSQTEGIDLQGLLYLITGGEPNRVNTCVGLSKHLQKLGAPSANVITPGFGMTETCAGSTYNKRCPEIDVNTQTEFTALGTIVPGMQMRLRSGFLEITGPIVFQRYFNNKAATQAAFTEDGWFKTGDIATIDAAGTLRFVGRSTDYVVINGVKYLPHELETSIDQARIPGVAISGVVCFAYRPDGAATEQIQVVYEHDYEVHDGKARIEALHAIIKSVVSFAGARPRVLPLVPGRLERSTLGKLSRAKVRASLLGGQYEEDISVDERMLQSFEAAQATSAANTAEQRLLQVFRDLKLGEPDTGVNVPFLDTGVNSVDLIRLKRAAEEAFSISNIPIITVMTNTTIRSLAVALQDMQSSRHTASYDPITMSQANGNENPP